MSHYANGSSGVVMTLVFYAFGIAALALAFRLFSAIDRQGVTRAFPYLMTIGGLAMLLAGAFEVDRPDAPETTGEVVHSNAAVAAFVLLVVSMALATMAMWRDDRWYQFRHTSAAITVVAALGAASSKISTGSSWTGLVQRVLAGAVLVWFVLVARYVRSEQFRLADGELPIDGGV